MGLGLMEVRGSLESMPLALQRKSLVTYSYQTGSCGMCGWL